MRRNETEHLNLGIDQAEPRLPTGRKGALPPVHPVALCLVPLVQSRQALPPPRVGEGKSTLRCNEGAPRTHRLLAALFHPIPALAHPATPRPAPPSPAPPRPERDEPSHPHLMCCMYQRWRVAWARMAFSWVDISVLAGGLRLRCDTSEREHVWNGDGDERGARAVPAQRGPSGFFEWRDSADLHHWWQGCRYLRWNFTRGVRSPSKPTTGLNAAP